MSERLRFEIGADLKPLNQALNDASNKIKSFADENKEKFEKFGKSVTDVGLKFSAISAGALAAVGALGMLAKNVGNVADRLLDLSDITGATTDAIQEWQYVAKIAGVNTETFTNATEGLVRRLKDVEGEGSPAVKVLNSLGIASKDSSGQIRNAGTIVDETITKLASLDNVTERNTLGSQLFGGAWKDVAPILSLGAEGIEQLKKEANDLGLVMSNESLQNANAFRQGIVKITSTFEALKNQIGAKLAPLLTKTLLPAIENYLIPAFQKLSDIVASVIDWFNGLDPIVKKIIAVLGGLLVAIGPLLVAIGGIIQFMPILISGFAALISPIGLIVLGIVALTAAIVANWDTVKKWAQDLVNYFIKLYNESIFFRGGIEGIIFVFKGLWEVTKFVFTSIYKVVVTVFKNIREALGNVGDLILSVLTFDLSGIKQALKKNFNAVTDNTKALFSEITNDAKTLFSTLAENRSQAVENVLNRKFENVDFTTKPEATKKLEEAVSGAVSAGVSAGLSGEGGRATAVGSNLQGAGMVAMPNAAPASDALAGFRETLDSEFVAIQIRMAEFNETINDLISNSIAGTFMSLGDAIGNALVNGGNVLGAIGKSLIQSMGKFLSNFGDQLITFGIASKAFAKLQLSLANPATAFISAGAAIAAGLALKIAGAAVASAGSSFGGGGGGTSSFSGSSATQTSSNVSSSSFSAQRNDEVVFRIAGTDLLGVLRRAENAENRIG
jgi:hypothetical protein